MESLTIRRYRPADAKAVWRVHETALRASPLTFVEDSPDDADLTAIDDQYLASGGEFLVGLVDRVVAIGGYQRRDPTTAEIRRLRVLPAYQRRGYGATLLARLEDRATERGIERFVLETHERLTAAQHLYETHGYEVTSRDSHSTTSDTTITYQKTMNER